MNDGTHTFSYRLSTWSQIKHIWFEAREDWRQKNRREKLKTFLRSLFAALAMLISFSTCLLSAAFTFYWIAPFGLLIAIALSTATFFAVTALYVRGFVKYLRERFSSKESLKSSLLNTFKALFAAALGVCLALIGFYMAVSASFVGALLISALLGLIVTGLSAWLLGIGPRKLVGVFFGFFASIGYGGAAFLGATNLFKNIVVGCVAVVLNTFTQAFFAGRGSYKLFLHGIDGELKDLYSAEQLQNYKQFLQNHKGFYRAINVFVGLASLSWGAGLAFSVSTVILALPASVIASVPPFSLTVIFALVAIGIFVGAYKGYINLVQKLVLDSPQLFDSKWGLSRKLVFGVVLLFSAIPTAIGNMFSIHGGDVSAVRFLIGAKKGSSISPITEVATWTVGTDGIFSSLAATGSNAVQRFVHLPDNVTSGLRALSFWAMDRKEQPEEFTSSCAGVLKSWDEEDNSTCDQSPV